MCICKSGWARIAVILFFLLGEGRQVCAQNLVLNGDFSTPGSVGWIFFPPGAYTETWLTESVYGGPLAANSTAEVDQLANLRQGGIPVTPGKSYYLSFRHSRRTLGGPGFPLPPVPSIIKVRVYDGTTVYVDQDILSANTIWDWQCQSFLFSPTTNTVTIDFANVNNNNTLGTILDDITLVPTDLSIITLTGTPCEGGNITLSAPQSIPPNTVYTNHTWTGPNGFTATGPDITFTGAQASLNGVYTCSMKLNECLTLTATYTLGITLQEENIQESICDGETYSFYGKILTEPGTYDTVLHGANAGDCDKKITLQLTVKPLPEAAIAGDAQVGYCAGDVLPTLHLEAPVPGVAYQWKKDGVDIAGETGPSFQVTSPGAYQVLGAADGCQALSDAVAVVEYPLPEARIRFDNTDLCILKDTALFAASECVGCSYFWQPEQAFRRTGVPDGAEVKGLFDASGLVVLTVYGEHGCQDKDSVGIIAHPCCEVFAPTAFSPNADGLNDLFMPYLERPQVLLDLSVYDRYGSRVYNYVRGDKGWNGMYKGGVPAAGGTYMYYMRYQCTDGKIYEKRGDLTLLR